MRRGPPNLSATVRRFAFEVVRERYGAPAVTDEGLHVDPSPTTATILAHVFPATSAAAAKLPDGVEWGRVVEGHTPDDVRGDIEGDADTPGTIADTLLVMGGRFKVVAVDEWAEGPAGDRTWRRFLAAEVLRT